MTKTKLTKMLFEEVSLLLLEDHLRLAVGNLSNGLVDGLGRRHWFWLKNWGKQKKWCFWLLKQVCVCVKQEKRKKKKEKRKRKPGKYRDDLPLACIKDLPPVFVSEQRGQTIPDHLGSSHPVHRVIDFGRYGARGSRTTGFSGNFIELVRTCITNHYEERRNRHFFFFFDDAVPKNIIHFLTTGW